MTPLPPEELEVEPGRVAKSQFSRGTRNRRASFPQLFRVGSERHEQDLCSWPGEQARQLGGFAGILAAGHHELQPGTPCVLQAFERGQLQPTFERFAAAREFR